MRGLLCIILFYKCLHARVFEARELPRDCGTLAHCAGAEALCVKIKVQKGATVNHHVILDKCHLHLLRCHPGRMEAVPVPMKFCLGDQLSKDAAVIKKRVRRHLEQSTTDGINKIQRHGKTSTVKKHSRLIGRRNVEKKIKAKRKRRRSLKKPSNGLETTQKQKKFKNKPKPIIRNHTNIRISKVKRSKTYKSTKRKPLVTTKMAPNFSNHMQPRLKGSKKRGRHHVPGSLAASLDYEAIFNNPNAETRQDYAVDMDPDDPWSGAEENQGDVGSNEGDREVNEGDGKADEDRLVNEVEGGADEGDGGVNEDGGDANEDGGVNEGGGGENEDGDTDEGDGGDGDENEGEVGVNEGDGEVKEADGEPDEGDREVNEIEGEADERDGGVNEDDGDATEDVGVNEGDGEVKEADGEPNEEDLEINEGDGGANKGDGGVNEDEELTKEENTDNVLWKGDNYEGNDTDNVEGIGKDVRNGNDGRDNVDIEAGNNEDDSNDLIAKVKQLTNPKLWNSISNGFRGVSVKINIAVNSG